MKRQNRRMNRETAAVLRWANDNPQLYSQMVKRAQALSEKMHVPTTEPHAIQEAKAQELATALAMIFEVDSPVDDDSSIFAVLLSWGLYRVDWSLLASRLLHKTRRKP